MKGIKNLGQACWRIRRGRALYADWHGLFRVSFGVRVYCSTSAHVAQGLSAGVEMRELMWTLRNGGELPIMDRVSCHGSIWEE
jgi:hypothetical protein